MKKQFMFSLAALVLSASAFGQVENDDMYFNSKDRAKLKAEKASEESLYMASAKKSKKADKVTEDVNPTDSYSARNVNPEFAARSNSQTAQTDNQDYFVNNYRYNTSSDLNKWNNNFNGWYNNSWYGSNYYSPGVYGWNSPYYGSAFDTWGNPWCNPYYQSNYSSSFSYYWGSSWNYGWGSGIGMSYTYGNPYMNSWYGYPGYGGYGYGGYGYGGYGYNPTVVIINNGGEYGGRNRVYGKRASHGGMVTVTDGTTRTRSSYSATSYTRPGSTGSTGGRVATSGRSQTQAEYYNRGWRNSQQTDSYSSYPTRGSSNNTRSSSYDPWGDSNNRGSDSYSNPSRSSSSYSGGGGSGTRTSAPASSGSNGRTRGRD